MGMLKIIGSRLMSRQDWLGRLVGSGMDWYEGWRGPLYAQHDYQQAQAAGRSVQRGLAEIAARWPDVASLTQENPVFILSAGWRSGSTLLQRLIMSRESILIWGEPYSHARMLHHLAASVSAITPDWPKDEWFVDHYPQEELSTRFVANMYPVVQDLLQACLAYTRTLLAEPARTRGFARWGLKDVRLTIDDAYFLRWLYPQGRFVFLCRNPYTAYRSYRLDRSWYNEWPDDPVFTAVRFGRHWRELTRGFQEGCRELGGVFLRYEDLCAGNLDVTALEAYLQLGIDTSLLKQKVGTHRHPNDAVPGAELKRLQREVAPLASTLGYEP
jgi:hypothetical protein